MADATRGGVGAPAAHDSAALHVSGEAVYVDDIPEPAGCLHVYPCPSREAHARLVRLDLAAVRAAPGVACALSAADIPGENDTSPTGTGDDPCLADGTIHFLGQPLFAVAAETIEQARAAAARAVVETEPLEPVLTVEQAMAAGSFVQDPHTMRRGDAGRALAAAPRRLSGRMEIGGQDHFYLEGQVSLAIPAEGGGMFVHCSTQHPSEAQHAVAKVLGRPDNAVTVETRRMGGAFGGKESQAAQWAALAALAADRTGRAAKLRLDRDDDMTMTGKRHDFVAEYDVGFGADGRILGLSMSLAARCGFSADLSGAIVDRAMFHADNCYHLPDVEIVGHRCRTNTVSNTAFRGFGGPQGMLAIERVVEEIARDLGLDPLEVRRRNLYDPPGGGSGRDVTHYGMKVEDNIAGALMEELARSARYAERRAGIDAFNAASPVLKRGIALTPVKFGISFTTTFLNQAGALVHIYKDGSVHLNHGGTEMGQGLYVKVAQAVAEEFQIDIDRIAVSAANTGKVPNTSPTAASSGSDMNGMAALAAARTLKERLARFAAARFGVAPSEVAFRANRVRAGEAELSFAELARLAWLGRVQLSATGFYRTPRLGYDREKAWGRPFFYFAYGAAVSEVAIDTLTGESKVLAVDILHDVGRSLNPAIDLGQIEGGFVQGMGWLTSEELRWDGDGRLMTHAPSTYKIPACGDRPERFRMAIWPRGENAEETIHRSKAVGEPPLILAISVLHAISDAVSSLSGGRLAARLDAPATPERILAAVEAMRARAGAAAGRRAAE